MDCMRRRVTATGPLDLRTAWERYLFPSRWPGWAPQIRSVDVAEDRLRPGLTGVVHGPPGVAVRFRIDAVDTVANTWAWTVTVAGARVRMHHDLRARGDGTVAGLTVEGPAPIVLTYPLGAGIALRRLLRP